MKTKPDMPGPADITHRLVVDRYHLATVLPRFTPKGWWECDVFELTKAGYFREYEVKVDRGDFRKDAEKSRRALWYDDSSVEAKHKLAASGDPRGPKQFWFCVPGSYRDGRVVGMVTPEECPVWAGLIVLAFNDNNRRYRLNEHVKKEAPVLHQAKADGSVFEQARECSYWRYHRLMASVKRNNR